MNPQYFYLKIPNTGNSKLVFYQPKDTGWILATILIHENKFLIFITKKKQLKFLGVIKKKIQIIIIGKRNHLSYFLFLNLNKNVYSNNKTENKDITVIDCGKARRASQSRVWHLEIRPLAGLLSSLHWLWHSVGKGQGSFYRH